MGKVFFFLGEEDLLKREAIERLRNSYGEKVAYYSFSPLEEGFSMEEVMRLARTTHLFSPHQVMVIKDIEKITPPDREMLISYLRNPAQSTDLILLSRLKLKKIDSSEESSWLNILLKEKNLKIREFSLLSGEELREWLFAQVNKRGKHISRPALDFLISQLGNDTASLSQAIEKAALYSGAKKMIEWADLEAIIGKVISLDIYKLIKALLYADLRGGIRILQDMRDFNVKPDKILGTLVAEWRKLYRAKKLLRKGISQFQIKKELSLFYESTFFANLQKISQDKLKDSLRHLLFIDYGIKTGREKPFLALEWWILRFLS
ncbi:MAG: DNA polymerase III subunit delta [Candidatus Omnitrophica bacterium]|nr:DNA polymerase III subunit delta [Candidatus Omnitrophota bacterium]MCM8798110.1 DNA polymerase III subunit delta [Candidatus Omnitrophota bacterium]